MQEETADWTDEEEEVGKEVEEEVGVDEGVWAGWGWGGQVDGIRPEVK